ncbi:MAG: flagellar biosynthesis protein FlhA [Phycisphaerales bacterium]|nr:MAG: flagellar biosynthesis protein FlhA [Phycisphaerales bacterium]
MAENTTPALLPPQVVKRLRALAYPLASMTLILVILVPLPTWLMDLLLVTNITASAVVLLTVMYMHGPLEFATFPSLLLSMTLFRLVLNTATTRLILTNADKGTAAAGHVIEQFGEFVASGSLVVGVIIFLIIIIIQFVVITKGATRIAEVAARFTLDGMPGKQMAIDADLNAGLIGEAEAKARREEITREADFFGAMDGAAKFVRGDAIAGLIITLINIVGGLIVGMIFLGQPLFWCLETFTKLTIGDGLVSQIPAFIVSIAAGMIITRTKGEESLGEELLGQFTSRPVALGVTAGFLGLLALTPLPKLPLLMMGGGCAGIAIVLSRQAQVARKQAEQVAAKDAARRPEKPETLLAVDPMELEVGYGLIRLVDRKQGGDLLDRITNMRRQIALDWGIVVPPIRIRDNIQLEPNQYVTKIRGMEVARGEVMPGQLLAIDSGMVTDPIGGIETKEPAFGLPALWISDQDRHVAEHRNYTVVEPSSVMATHLTEVIRSHAAELLTREEVHRLLDNLKERSPKVVEELVPEVMKPGEVQKVLQALLRERVPIRDLETILETLADWAARTKDADVLTEYVRNALARTICQQYRDPGEPGGPPKIHCITLDPKVEDLLNAHLDRSETGSVLTISPAVQNQLVSAVREQIDEAIKLSGGRTVVILCSPQVRAWVRRMIEPGMPQIGVLAYNEIVRGLEVVSHGMVVLPNELADVSS